MLDSRCRPRHCQHLAACRSHAVARTNRSRRIDPTEAGTKHVTSKLGRWCLCCARAQRYVRNLRGSCGGFEGWGGMIIHYNLQCYNITYIHTHQYHRYQYIKWVHMYIEVTWSSVYTFGLLKNNWDALEEERQRYALTLIADNLHEVSFTDPEQRSNTNSFNIEWVWPWVLFLRWLWGFRTTPSDLNELHPCPAVGCRLSLENKWRKHPMAGGICLLGVENRKTTFPLMHSRMHLGLSYTVDLFASSSSSSKNQFFHAPKGRTVLRVSKFRQFWDLRITDQPCRLRATPWRFSPWIFLGYTASKGHFSIDRSGWRFWWFLSCSNPFFESRAWAYILDKYIIYI